MTQYIDKSALENILRGLWKEDDGKNSEHRICYNKALQDVQCEIDSLEVKEVDLEKAASKYAKSEYDRKNPATLPERCKGCYAPIMYSFKAGAKWQKNHLWKSADSDNLPEIDREVIVLTQPYQNDEHLRVMFAHRPNKYAKVWNSDLGEEQVIEIERHGKGGWNIPDVKWWLDCLLPNMED